ncbi:Uncharacterised protein [Mycobacteroides abscessus subsp. abscessus]|nr:Uncharacterised protein [Mycobacteroides abscessus subsp. abscessus]
MLPTESTAPATIRPIRARISPVQAAAEPRSVPAWTHHMARPAHSIPAVQPA